MSDETGGRAQADSEDDPAGTDVSPSGSSENERINRFRRSKRSDRRRGSFWRELPVLLVVAFVLALLIKTFLVQAFFIPSSSMEQTLHGCPGCSGDRVLVNKLSYRFHDPRPGDIVVFRGPSSWQAEVQVSEPGNPVSKFFRSIAQAVGAAQPNEKDFVKRVIATAGQTVACCDAKGRVTVDNRPLTEPYIYQNSPDLRSTVCATGRSFDPVKVPTGRLWVMGDHRRDSADSRCHVSDSSNGTIPVDDVIGKAFVTVWPPSRWRTLGTPHEFAAGAAGAELPLIGAPLLVGALAAGPLARRRRQGSPRRRSR